MEVTCRPSIREQRKPLTAAYVRVSTKREIQDGSFEAQKKYYEDLIRSNPEWEFVGIYAEKASGTDREHRPVFQQLIQDTVDRKVDLILCKSLSRWARNTIDALATIKTVKGNGARILFLEDHIDTAKPGMLLQITVGSAVAQQESKSISENIKWTYRENAKRGIFKAQPGKYFGYNTDDGNFTPDENAKYVKLIYEWYADGMPIQMIADTLKEIGVLTTAGNPFTRDAVSNILQNEIYVGDIQFQKRPSVDVISGIPDKEQVDKYIEDHHEGLVSRKLWDSVQEIIEKKQQKHDKGEAEREQILKLMQGNDRITVDQICDEIGIEARVARYHIRCLKEKGLLSRNGSPRTGKWVVYSELIQSESVVM